MNVVDVDGKPFRLPAGARVKRMWQERHGPVLLVEWAWWRPRWSRPTKWM